MACSCEARRSGPVVKRPRNVAMGMAGGARSGIESNNMERCSRRGTDSQGMEMIRVTWQA